MEWNMKAPPSWDLSEVDQASLSSNMETMDGSNSFAPVYRTKGEFSVDLKLGHHVGNSESVVVNKSKMAPSSSGSSKRARAINNGTQTVSCLVDGCQADLSNSRDYHRRHKVCELHSKTAQVTIGGNKQRFCQQCSRFHSLEEFDEGKRSCRKRLDGHNRRRRKPQPEGLTRSGGFLSNYQAGTQLLPFSNVYPSSAMVNPAGWGGGGGGITSCPDIIRLHSHNQQQELFIGSSSPTRNYKEGMKQLAFMQQQGDQQHFPVAAAANSMSLTSSDSSCALSLLSSPSLQTHTNHNHMMVNHPISSTTSSSSSSSFMQPLGLSLHDPVVLGPNGSSTTSTHDHHCSSIYNNMGSNDQSHGNNNEASPLFPFQWE